MLYIPNSAEGKCLTEKENHTLCLKSDRKPKNLRMTKNVMVRNSPTLPTMLLLKTADLCFLLIAHDQYTYPLARPLLIALQVARTSFGFHLMGSSFPPPGSIICANSVLVLPFPIDQRALWFQAIQGTVEHYFLVFPFISFWQCSKSVLVLGVTQEMRNNMLLP